MKQILFIGIIGLMAVLSSFAASEDDSVTLQGVIEAVEWDEEGLVTVIALVVEDTVVSPEGETEVLTEKYKIGITEQGLPLLDLIESTVEVTGRVETDEEGEKVIYVSSFKIISNEMSGCFPVMI